MIKFKKLILFFILKNSYLIFCQDLNENDINLDKFISGPKLIKNQLCSFNGISLANSTHIKCKCYNGFIKDNNIRKINNYEVDCSYFLKSRLITLTLSLIFPIGIDYFYLGHNIFGSFVFIIVFIIFGLNIWLLNWVLVYDKLTSVGNVDKIFEKKYIRLKYSVLIIDIIFIFLYIFNAIMQGAGAIKDSNGFITNNDFALDE